MKCPSCGEGKLVRATRAIPYTYQPQACGESAAESKRVTAAMLEFNKRVNASIVDPGFIACVRKKLALDQRQAAAIFGGGANAFSRYENGKTKPPLALVKLLLVLDRHPHLLNEVRAGLPNPQRGDRRRRQHHASCVTARTIMESRAARCSQDLPHHSSGEPPVDG
jgi:HTH-type transcriptional regulator/antitoxin MqsA